MARSYYDGRLQGQREDMAFTEFEGHTARAGALASQGGMEE